MYGPRRPFPDGNDRAGRCYPAGGMGGGFSGRRSPSPNYSDHDTVPAVDEDSSSEGSFASSRYDLPSDLRGGYGGGYGPRGGHGREYRSLGGHGREYRSLGGHGREYRSLGGHGGGYGPRGGHGGGYGPRGGHSGGYGPRDDDGDDDDGDDDDGDDDDGDDDDGDDDDGDDLDGDDDGNPGFWVATRSGSNFFIARDRVTEISYQTTTPTNPGPERGGYRGMTPGMEGPGGRYGEQGGMTLGMGGRVPGGYGGMAPGGRRRGGGRQGRPGRALYGERGPEDEPRGLYGARGPEDDLPFGEGAWDRYGAASPPPRRCWERGARRPREHFDGGGVFPDSGDESW